MLYQRTAITAFVPSSLVAARFLIPGSTHDGYTLFFATAGFLATMIGCVAALALLRKRAALIPLPVAAIIGVIVAGILLAAFPLMPRLPLVSEGLLVVWILFAALLTAALIAMISRRYAVR